MTRYTAPLLFALALIAGLLLSGCGGSGGYSSSTVVYGRYYDPYPGWGYRTVYRDYRPPPPHHRPPPGYRPPPPPNRPPPGYRPPPTHLPARPPNIGRPPGGKPPGHRPPRPTPRPTPRPALRR